MFLSINGYFFVVSKEIAFSFGYDNKMFSTRPKEWADNQTREHLDYSEYSLV
ncbi:MAG: hypothetical protein PHE49_01580 [bacterium]|nr:hypothetical protein [bacterium]